MYLLLLSGLCSLVFCEHPNRFVGLLLIDVQNDFLPSTAYPLARLSVPGGDEIIPVLNKLRRKVNWGTIAYTQDYHPADHVSFLSSHLAEDPDLVPQWPDAEGIGDYGKLYTWEDTEGRTREQILWPDHCTRDDPTIHAAGVNISCDLEICESDYVLHKGVNVDQDSYSAFQDNDKLVESPLNGFLKGLDIRTLVIGGLAADVCVAYSILDAIDRGYNVYVPTDGTKAVNLTSWPSTKQMLAARGAKFRTSDWIIDHFNECPSAVCDDED